MRNFPFKPDAGQSTYPQPLKAGNAATVDTELRPTFIPFAVCSGLIMLNCSWIIGKACLRIKRRQDGNPAELFMAAKPVAGQLFARKRPVRIGQPMADSVHMRGQFKRDCSENILMTNARQTTKRRSATTHRIAPGHFIQRLQLAADNAYQGSPFFPRMRP